MEEMQLRYVFDRLKASNNNTKKDNMIVTFGQTTNMTYKNAPVAKLVEDEEKQKIQEGRRKTASDF
jgi:hypothetical protein